MTGPGNQWQFATVGLEMLGYVLVFVGGGYLLDRWLHTTPLWIIVGAVVGIGGGLAKVIRDAWQANQTLGRAIDKDRQINDD